jgi:hypothetical protein
MACIKSTLLGTFLASISVVSFSHNAKALDLSGPFNLAQNQDNQENSQYQGNSSRAKSESSRLAPRPRSPTTFLSTFLIEQFMEFLPQFDG